MDDYDDEGLYGDEDEGPFAALLGYGGYGDLGAVRARRGGGRAVALRRVAVRRAAVRRAVVTPVPRVPGVEVAMLPLGFTTIQFVNAGATSLIATSTPQKPIKGQRLVVSLARTAAAVELVTITSFLIGSTNVLPSAQPISVDAFAGNAFHTVLDLPPAGPGITLTLTFAVSAAPGVGETIDVATTLIGPSFAG